MLTRLGSCLSSRKKRNNVSTGADACLTPTRSSARKVSNVEPELELLEQVATRDQLGPIVVEIVRRLFPTCYFIVARSALEYSETSEGKLINFLHAQLIHHVEISNEPVECRNASSKYQPAEAKSFHEESLSDFYKETKQKSGTLTFQQTEITDRDMRELFLLHLIPSAKTAYLHICFILSAEKTLFFVSFHCDDPFTVAEKNLLSSLENRLRRVIIRTNMVQSEFSNEPGFLMRQSMNTHLGDKRYHLFAESMHFVCKKLAEACDNHLVFVLLPSVNVQQLVCPATSRTLVLQKKVVRLKTSFFQTAFHSDSVCKIDDPEELRLIERAIVGRPDKNKEPWNLITYFAVDLFADFDHSKFNGGIGIAQIQHLLSSEGDDQLTALICVVNLHCPKLVVQPGYNSSSGGLEEIRHRMVETIKTFNKRIRRTYMLMCREENELISQRLLHTISTLKQSASTSTAWLKMLIDHLTKFVQFDGCSVYIFDETLHTWTTKIQNYPREKSAGRRASSEPPEMLSKVSYNDHENLEERIAEAAKANPSTLWIPLNLDGKQTNALVQLKWPFPLKSYHRQNISQQVSNYCRVGVLQFQILQRKERLANREVILQDILKYHLKAAENDVRQLCGRLEQQEPRLEPGFFRFEFIARKLNEDESVKDVLCMFIRLQFVNQWRIPLDVLARFVLTVRKSYRSPAYHNWTHAFCVGHFAFLCLFNASQCLNQLLDPLEQLALLVGALCHDIDHPGFNNSYQRLTNSPLAALYGENGSILEYHHVDHTMRILQIPECDILVHLTKEEKDKALRTIKTIILATDLENHIRIMPSVRAMATQGYDRMNEEHHTMLLSILVTASDLSDQCKSWINTRIAASQIYSEFFNQGDREKECGNSLPPSLDRERAFIPKLQLDFLDSIVLPCFETLSTLIPDCDSTVENVHRNRNVWDYLSKIFQSERHLAYSTEKLLTGQFDHLAGQALLTVQ